MKKQNMKVCRLDRLGRVVIPKPMRSLLGETPDSTEPPEVKVSVSGDKIIVEKAIPECALCSSTDNLIDFENNNICTKCVKKIAKL